MDQDQQTPQQKTDQQADQASAPAPATPETAPVAPPTAGMPADQPIQENTPGMQDNSGSMPKKRALAILAVIVLIGLAFLITQLLR
jgi:hypothetical protein